MIERELAEKALETRRRLLPPPAAAERLGGIAVGTLAKWRHYGSGPPYVRLNGGRIFYDIDDLDAFIEAHRRTSTSEAA